MEMHFPNVMASKCLVACSGGVDSMVLVHLCDVLDMDFDLVHCNFQLRGEESDLDKELVVATAALLKRKVFLKSFDLSSAPHRGSTQMVARELRYQWFHTLLLGEGYDYLLTAHHKNDSLETFLIHLSRGTGLDGLLGIPAKNGKIIRPLLPFGKQVIVGYADENQLSWREDRSNAEDDYLRNKIRHHLIPLLEELHPNFWENFDTTQHNLQGTKNLLQGYRKELRERLFHDEAGKMKISISKLKHLSPLKDHLYLLLKPYGFTEWGNVSALLDAASGKRVLSPTHELVKHRDYLILSPIASEPFKEFSFGEWVTQIHQPFPLTLEMVDDMHPASKKTIFLDKEKISFPLVIRKWKKGDYFYPFGMQGRKKLSKYFKDERMDILSKREQWLLCSQNDIVWVVGKRMDDRFKVTGTTKQIVKLSMDV